MAQDPRDCGGILLSSGWPAGGGVDRLRFRQQFQASDRAFRDGRIRER